MDIPSRNILVKTNNDTLVIKDNLFKSKTIEDLYNTIDYLLEKYGKITYIKIYQNKVISFLPLKNFNYINYWQKQYVDGFPKGFVEFQQNFTAFVDNFLIKNFNHDNEINWINKMFEILCKNREIADTEFIINTERLFPMITINSSEADFGCFNNYNTKDFDIPLVQHTVVGFKTSKNFKDFCIPTFVDANRIFDPNMTEYKAMKWFDKQLEFYFRSDSAYPGIFLDKSPFNMKYVLINRIRKFIPQYANVGITTFVPNEIIVNGKLYKPIKKPEFFITETETELYTKSKFVIVMDNFSDIMFSGSCILKVETKWQLWFSDKLIPYIHFVPIKEDLSDLEIIIQWCIDNDDLCNKIGRNARVFALKYLTFNGTLDYLQNLCNNKINRLTHQTTVFNVQQQLQRLLLLENSNKIAELTRNEQKKSKIFVQQHLSGFKTQNNIKLSVETNTAISYLQTVVFLHQKELYTSHTYNNIAEGINDAFIGILCVNKLCKIIPNFVYTYKYLQQNNGTVVIFREKIHDSENLDVFLSKHCYSEIYDQLEYSLKVAMNECCFIHGNLIPENIKVQYLKSPIKITYIIDLNEEHEIITKYLVIITSFAKSKCLYTYNKERIFFGMFSEYKNIAYGEKVPEEIFHIKDTNHEYKQLLKYVGKKIVKKILPEKIQSKQDTGVRLIYDKMMGVENPHELVHDRIFVNTIPRETSGIGNVILKYEILHTLTSAFADLKMKINVNVVLSEKFSTFIQFITDCYDKFIQETADVEFTYDENDDIWAKKMVIIKYYKILTKNKHFKTILKNIKNILSSELLSSIILASKNTIRLYEK